MPSTSTAAVFYISKRGRNPITLGLIANSNGFLGVANAELMGCGLSICIESASNTFCSINWGCCFDSSDSVGASDSELNNNCVFTTDPRQIGLRVYGRIRCRRRHRIDDRLFHPVVDRKRCGRHSRTDKNNKNYQFLCLLRT